MTTSGYRDGGRPAGDLVRSCGRNSRSCEVVYGRAALRGTRTRGYYRIGEMRMLQDRTRMATVAVAMALACVAWGQEPSSTNRFVTEGDPPITPKAPSKIAPHFMDVDFSSIAQAVGHSSGRTLVVGPGVCALVSASWETELTGEQFYQAFVSIARTLGFVVVEQGSVTTITLDDNARKDSPPRCRRYPETEEPEASSNR